MMQEYATLLDLLIEEFRVSGLCDGLIVMFDEVVLCLRANSFGDDVKSREVRMEEG